MFILEIVRDILFYILVGTFTLGFFALLMPFKILDALVYIRYRADLKKENMTEEEARKYEARYSSTIGYLILGFVLVFFSYAVLDGILK